MKKIFVVLGISSAIILLFQAYLISEIYSINENINATMEDMNRTNQSESAATDVITNTSSTFKFKDIITKGKSTLLNVIDIKPSSVINYNKIACLDGDIFSSPSKVVETACDAIGVIEDGNYIDPNSTIYEQTPAVSSSLLTAISQGIEKPIAACYYHYKISPQSQFSDIQPVSCDTLYILYN